MNFVFVRHLIKHIKVNLIDSYRLLSECIPRLSGTVSTYSPEILSFEGIHSFILTSSASDVRGRENLYKWERSQLTEIFFVVNIMMFNSSPSNIDPWAQPALASCFLLKWIGSYLCFIFICGIVLNVFVLYTTINKKSLQSPISIFIIALSSSDLIQSLFGIPLPLTSNFACR